MVERRKKPAPRIVAWSTKTLAAAKAFKGIKVAKAPEKLRGKKATEIERAVRDYYLGR